MKKNREQLSQLVHHLLYEELSLGMEHHIYVPLHEAELRLALEIGHGILCEKN
jgi:hypothetical protein